MNELTKREQIALAMLQGKPDLVRSHDEVKALFIADAFEFADLFFPYLKIRQECLFPKMMKQNVLFVKEKDLYMILKNLYPRRKTLRQEDELSILVL